MFFLVRVIFELFHIWENEDPWGIWLTGRKGQWRSRREWKHLPISEVWFVLKYTSLLMGGK